MAWKINLSTTAKKQLSRLEPQTARRILKFLSERLAPLDDPRCIGEALRGSRLGNFWKYRVGDYRIIVDIQDGEMNVYVVRIGNRREVYRKE